MRDVVDLRGHSDPLDRPRLIAQLATEQGGPISRHQLLELGVSQDAIKSWLRSGRLHCHFRGVYLLGHEAISAKGRLHAAVLAFGPGAVISHRSAADWWGILPTSRRPVDVTVTGRSKAGQPGIDLHLVRNLDPRDVTNHDGVPITTIARTLLDLAEVAKPRQLKRSVEEADRLQLFNGEAWPNYSSGAPAGMGSSHCAIS